MSDFCKACAEELFGPETPSDFRAIFPKNAYDGGKVIYVLCEGCGFINVNFEGECVDCDLKKGAQGHGPKDNGGQREKP